MGRGMLFTPLYLHKCVARFVGDSWVSHQSGLSQAEKCEFSKPNWLRGPFPVRISQLQCGKTRVMFLPRGRKSLTICTVQSFISTHAQHWTNGQKWYIAVCMLEHADKKKSVDFSRTSFRKQKGRDGVFDTRCIVACRVYWSPRWVRARYDAYRYEPRCVSATSRRAPATPSSAAGAACSSIASTLQNGGRL